MHSSVEQQQEDFGIEQQAFQDLERDFQDVSKFLTNSFHSIYEFLIIRFSMNYQATQV